MLVVERVTDLDADADAVVEPVPRGEVRHVICGYESVEYAGRPGELFDVAPGQTGIEAGAAVRETDVVLVLRGVGEKLIAGG